jgi:hypothetical protein
VTGAQLARSQVSARSHLSRLFQAGLQQPARGPLATYVPDFDKLRTVSTRIVSAAGESSGQQGARRAAVALADRLGIPVTYLPGAHGGWGSEPQEFAKRLDEVLQDAEGIASWP